MKITFPSADHYELCNFRFEGLTERRYLVFDLEGTGPDPNQNSVTQIGAVRYDPAIPDFGMAFDSLVKPGQPIPPKIEELTGVTNERVAESECFAVVFARFKEFCGDAVLVTQCGYEYDYRLLEHECERAGIAGLANEQLDTKAIFALLHPERRETFSTNFLSGFYGIDPTEFKRHDALGDAKLITRIFQAELAEAKQMGIDDLATDRVRINRFVLS